LSVEALHDKEIIVSVLSVVTKHSGLDGASVSMVKVKLTESELGSELALASKLNPDPVLE